MIVRAEAKRLEPAAAQPKTCAIEVKSRTHVPRMLALVLYNRRGQK